MIIEPSYEDTVKLLMERYHALLNRLSEMQEEHKNRTDDPRNISTLLTREIHYWFENHGKLS